VTSRRAARRGDKPEFVGRNGPYDTFRLGPKPGGTLLLVPAIGDAWPAEVKNAVERRRRATLYGRCDCGARQGRPKRAPDGVLHAAMAHEHDCPAGNEVIAELFRFHGITLDPETGP